MCRCVWKTATAGGKTARMISPARMTGTTDGTGARVSTKTNLRARKDQQILFTFSTQTHERNSHICTHTQTTNRGLSPCPHSSARPVILDQQLLIVDCDLDSRCLTGINKCPADAKCRKWTEVFPTPKAMCEEIWSQSYVYTTHSKTSGRCMQLWFNGTNPNKKVAESYLSNAQQCRSFAFTMLLCVAIASFFQH